MKKNLVLLSILAALGCSKNVDQNVPLGPEVELQRNSPIVASSPGSVEIPRPAVSDFKEAGKVTAIQQGPSSSEPKLIPDDSNTVPPWDAPSPDHGPQADNGAIQDEGSVVPPSQTPDSSYTNIWVKIFPILSRQSNDPYKLTRDPYSITLTNKFTLKVQDLESKKLIASGKEMSVSAADNRIAIDHKAFSLTQVKISGPADHPTEVCWDSGRACYNYRGSFNLTLTGSNGRIPQIVNILPLEEYLRGVVPSEMPVSFLSTSLSVQAIIARTYALYSAILKRRGHKNGLPDDYFDIEGTTTSQLYQGTKKENSKTDIAVGDTAGRVVVFKGRIIQAMYHANSGGRTCAIWDCALPAKCNSACIERLQQEFPYLTSVEDAPGVRDEPSTGRHIIQIPRRKLTSDVQHISGFRDVVTYLNPIRNESERIYELDVQGASDSVVISQEKLSQLHHAWRTGNYYEVTHSDEQVIHVARYGFGHGIGLSQVGANIYAEQGMSPQEIIGHYYSGAKVAKISDLPGN